MPPVLLEPVSGVRASCFRANRGTILLDEEGVEYGGRGRVLVETPSIARHWRAADFRRQQRDCERSYYYTVMTFSSERGRPRDGRYLFNPDGIHDLHHLHHVFETGEDDLEYPWNSSKAP